MGELYSFGEWVRRRRRALDLTQDALAQRVGVAVSMVRKVEADERRPSRQVAALLAEALAVPVAEREQFLRAARAELSPDQLAAPADELPLEPAAVVPRAALLPQLSHALIGREREHAELVALLQRPAVRLVTVTGPGGTGKTSLALQAAHALAPAFPDDAWFVDLAPVSDVARVAPAIVQALGLPESAHSDAGGPAAVWERLGRWLSTRRVLLILDNLEQVADVAPQLVGLLRDAPGVQVLATSRLALRLSQEREYPLTPLPPPPAAAGAAEIGASPAVQLFVERAQAVRPAFALTDETAAPVAAICVALDGLPLALELAAARVRVFSPQELAARLERDGGLRLLTRGTRDLPARQQTIRSAIQWSYELLVPEEQRLLARLSVFVGGWTLALAEAVCSGDGERDGDVLDVLERLVEHSLVQRRDAHDEDLPLRLLETVREFAHEQLLVAGEVVAMRDRHLQACVALAEEAEPHTRSGAQLAWLARLDAAYDNLRAALVWALDEGADEVERRTMGLRLAGALWYYWFIRGRFQEMFHWLDHPATNDERLPAALRAHMLLGHWAIVTDTGGQTEPFSSGVRGQVLAERAEEELLLARWFTLSGDFRDAQRARALAPLIHDPWWSAWLAFWLTMGSSGSLGSTPRAEQRQTILAAARGTGDRALLGRVLAHLAYEHLMEGDFAVAQQYAQEELQLAHRLNFTFGIASALFVLTRVEQAQGDLTGARSDNDIRYAAERLVDNPHGYTITLLDSIRLAICQSDYQRAVELFVQVEQPALTTWGTLDVYALWAHAWLALEQGHGTLAAAYTRQALMRCSEAEVQKLDFDTRHFLTAGRLMSNWMFGTIEAAEGRIDEATSSFQSALSQLQAQSLEDDRMSSGYLTIFILGDPGVVALSGLGRIAAYHPDPAWVHIWLNEQLTAIRERAGVWETTIARAVWGRTFLGWGDYTAAATQFADDLRFYRKSGARRMAAETLEGLGMCAAQAQPARAARLWGAAVALRAEIGAPMWPCDRPLYELHVAHTRVALGASAFDAAWSAGQTLTWQQAANEALALGEEPAVLSAPQAASAAADDLAHEAALAAEIQAGLLPAALPERAGWQLAAALLPARETAGDFYDCIALPDGRLVLVVADVAGKGLGAALYMATGRALLRTLVAFGTTDPAALLAGMNTRLLEDTHAGLFITAFVGVLDPASGLLSYANAGHPPAVQIRTGRGVRLLGPTGLVLGVEPQVVWRTETALLEDGDALLLYTDGVTEAQDRRGAFFDTERLFALLDATSDADTLIGQVQAAVAAFSAGAPQSDDITLLGVCRAPHSPA